MQNEKLRRNQKKIAQRGNMMNIRNTLPLEAPPSMIEIGEGCDEEVSEMSEISEMSEMLELARPEISTLASGPPEVGLADAGMSADFVTQLPS
ncbi:hypothetical protein OXX80_001024 [Metschnikowia pulcherrima]